MTNSQNFKTTEAVCSKLSSNQLNAAPKPEGGGKRAIYLKKCLKTYLVFRHDNKLQPFLPPKIVQVTIFLPSPKI